MLLNRISAVTQAAAITVTILTATRPLDLGWVHGPWSNLFGWAAVAASLTVLVRPNRQNTEASLAGLATSFWALRAIDLTLAWVDGTATPTPAAIHAALAVHTFLFAYRSIMRIGFHNRFPT